MQQLEPDNFNKIIPMAFVGWDNTPRRGKKGIIMTDNAPEIFAAELVRLKRKMAKADCNNGLLFINAWNEWAEGNHLEPDQKNGLAYLEVIKQIHEHSK